MRRINKFRIIDFGLADFSEYYPQGRVDVGGPTHATPKRGPLHISLGKLDMSLPLPMSMQQMKALPKVCSTPCWPWGLPWRVSFPGASKHGPGAVNSFGCCINERHSEVQDFCDHPGSLRHRRRAEDKSISCMRRCLRWSASTASSGGTRATSTTSSGT